MINRLHRDNPPSYMHNDERHSKESGDSVWRVVHDATLVVLKTTDVDGVRIYYSYAKKGRIIK